MKLAKLRLCNFQSFSSTPVDIELSAVTFLLGPNGSGKTAVLVAMARLFGFERSMRPIRRTDFHAANSVPGTATAAKQRLWIEAHFDFPELKKKTRKIRNHPAELCAYAIALSRWNSTHPRPIERRNGRRWRNRRTVSLGT